MKKKISHVLLKGLVVTSLAAGLGAVTVHAGFAGIGAVTMHAGIVNTRS